MCPLTLNATRLGRLPPPCPFRSAPVRKRLIPCHFTAGSDAGDLTNAKKRRGEEAKKDGSRCRQFLAITRQATGKKTSFHKAQSRLSMSHVTPSSGISLVNVLNSPYDHPGCLTRTHAFPRGSYHLTESYYCPCHALQKRKPDINPPDLDSPSDRESRRGGLPNFQTKPAASFSNEAFLTSSGRIGDLTERDVSKTSYTARATTPPF
jgi:hypothetical protein